MTRLCGAWLAGASSRRRTKLSEAGRDEKVAAGLRKAKRAGGKVRGIAVPACGGKLGLGQEPFEAADRGAHIERLRQQVRGLVEVASSDQHLGQLRRGPGGKDRDVFSGNLEASYSNNQVVVSSDVSACS